MRQLWNDHGLHHVLPSVTTTGMDDLKQKCEPMVDIFFVIKPVTVVLIEEIIKANDSVKKVMIRKRGSPTTHSSLCAIGWGEDRLYIYTRQAQDSESIIVVVVVVGAKCSAWQISHTLLHNSLW